MSSSGPTSSRKIYALSEITGSITRMFEKFYDTPYWIKGEISALNLYPTTGHCFPLIVEKSEGRIKAQLKAIIWKDDLYNISHKFEEVTRETLKEGLNILFLAYVKFSSVYGLTLQIIDIEPLYTLGEMARDKMNTILELKKEGVFEVNKSRPLPDLLKRIAIISVESSKGYNDLMVTLRDNKQGYKVTTRLFPAVLQGKGAVETITARLNDIREYVHIFDAVVIVRGGGDDVGLSCYDDLIMAREVATFPIPVITGIGHSTNETVVEMVACVNKITPTDVAHYILSTFAEQDKKLMNLKDSIMSGVAAIISDQKELIQESAGNFSNLAKTLLINNKIALSRYEMSLSYYPSQKIKTESVRLKNLTELLSKNIQLYLSNANHSLAEKHHRLRLLDPENVLKRGYSILRVQGKVADGPDHIKKGSVIEVETALLRITGEVSTLIEKHGS